MSSLLDKWSLAVEYEPTDTLSVRFRYFSTERAARRAFRKDYENNTNIRAVFLCAPLKKDREQEKLK